MRLPSWLGSWTTASRPRRRPAAPRRATAKPRLHTLEDRAVPAFGFGWALGVGGHAGWGITTDAQNNVYVTGTFSGTVDLDPQAAHPDNRDILTAPAGDAVFAAKYAAGGQFQWAANLGSNFGGPSIAVRDSATVGEFAVYVAHLRPDGTGGHTTQVTRLNADGTFAWPNPVALPGSVGGYLGVAVGPSGHVYVSGTTGTSSAKQAYVAKLDPSGTPPLWLRTANGGHSEALFLAVDHISETVYVTGNFNSAGGAVTFAPGAAGLTSRSNSRDAFVWKLSPAGDADWAGGLGSSGDDGGSGVAVDASGHVIVTGSWGGEVSTSVASRNNDFDPGPGTRQLTNTGQRDAFVVKLVPNPADGGLSLTAQGVGWARSFGGREHDQSSDVAVDGAGNVYLTGQFSRSVDFDPGSGSHVLTSAGGVDVFVSKLSPGGTFVAAARMGGGGSDIGFGIAVDRSGPDPNLPGVYTTGWFNLTADFEPTAATYNLTSTGSNDGFVSKLVQAAPLRTAGGPATGTTAARLTDAALQPIIAAAIDRWAAAGVDAARLGVMRTATVTVADLGGAYLGLADPVTHGVRIDDDAAGYGWFVDPTPRDDAEFARPGDKRVRGRMDLLTAVAHELGHLVGLDHDPDADHGPGVMGDALAAGTRRTPTADDVPPVIVRHQRVRRR